MARSLSILLPVHNVQSVLSRQVEHVLELVGELTHQFEILILDDGSYDHTTEVATELALRYPQIDVMRNNARGGLKQLVERGLERCVGEVVIVHDGTGKWDPLGIRQLWHRRDDPALVMARNPLAQGWYLLRKRGLESMTPKERLLAVDHEIRIIRADLVRGGQEPSRRPKSFSHLQQVVGQ
ncbi:MAG: glycosyltransferase [Pirellulales bacterium]